MSELRSMADQFEVATSDEGHKPVVEQSLKDKADNGKCQNEEASAGSSKANKKEMNGHEHP